MKRMLTFVIVLCSLVCLYSCSKDSDSDSGTKSLSFSPSSLTLSVGEKGTATIVATGVNDFKVDFSAVDDFLSTTIVINNTVTVVPDETGSGNIYVYSVSDPSIKGTLSLTVK